MGIGATSVWSVRVSMSESGFVWAWGCLKPWRMCSNSVPELVQVTNAQKAKLVQLSGSLEKNVWLLDENGFLFSWEPASSSSFLDSFQPKHTFPRCASIFVGSFGSFAIDFAQKLWRAPQPISIVCDLRVVQIDCGKDFALLLTSLFWFLYFLTDFVFFLRWRKVVFLGIESVWSFGHWRFSHFCCWASSHFSNQSSSFSVYFLWLESLCLCFWFFLIGFLWLKYSLDEGELFCWGWGLDGCLGLEDRSESNLSDASQGKVLIGFEAPIIKACCGYSSTLALDSMSDLNFVW